MIDKNALYLILFFEGFLFGSLLLWFSIFIEGTNIFTPVLLSLIGIGITLLSILSILIKNK